MLRTWPSRRKDEAFAPSDISGTNLLDIFSGMVDDIEATPVRDEAKKQSLRVSPDSKRTGSAAVLAEFRVGSWGNQGDEVTDEKSGKTRFTFDEDDSHPVKTRSALVVVPGEKQALLFSEHESGSSSATKVASSLKHAFAEESLTVRVAVKKPSKKGPKHTDVRVTLDVERFQEPRAWLDEALIKQIGVSMKTHDQDFSVGDASQHGETSMLVAPHRALMPHGSKFFDKVVSRVLMQSKMEAAIYLGIATPEDVEEVEDITVTVERDGKTKTYSLEKESLPSFRRPLSQQGLPPLSDLSFMEAVKEETEDFFRSLNRQLSADWIDLADYEPQ